MSDVTVEFELTSNHKRVTIEKTTVQAVSETSQSGTMITVIGGQNFHVTKEYEDVVFLIFG